jgi:hypothetical protein
MLGMSLSTFTLVHVVTSLIGVGSGFVVLLGSYRVSSSPDGLCCIVSLLVLAVAILERYGFHLAGAWNRIYAIGAMGLLTAKMVKNATLKVYPGSPHGMCTTEAVQGERRSARLHPFLVRSADGVGKLTDSAKGRLGQNSRTRS